MNKKGKILMALAIGAVVILVGSRSCVARSSTRMKRWDKLSQ